MALRARELIGPFKDGDLERVCRILADTTTGLTGNEIGHWLASIGVPDSYPTMTKWKRLYNAFVEYQNAHHAGNHVIVFINRVMNPARYTGNPSVFTERQDELNAALAFSGFSLGDDGKIRHTATVTNLDDALKRAKRLHGALVSRTVHADVLRFCKAELLQENYFHAVFEAMKSIAAKIRHLSSLDGDGADLMHKAFGGSCPVLAINELRTESQRSEQRGFVNLLVGLFGTVRNPLAHDPKIEWEMSEQDTLDILTTLSLIHRKLDKAHRS